MKVYTEKRVTEIRRKVGKEQRHEGETRGDKRPNKMHAGHRDLTDNRHGKEA